MEQTMSTDENVKLVLRYWQEVWNEGNLSPLGELFAPHLISGQHFFVSRTLAAFNESVVTIEDVIAQDDKVVVRYRWDAVHTGIWELELASIPMNVPPTGKRVWDRGIAIFQIRDGKINNNWSEWTKLELAQQLGVIGP
jgi:predicted ester cyclase